MGHNVSGFDIPLLMCDGFKLPPCVRDSMVAMHTRNENERQSKVGKPYALKKLVAQYRGEQFVQASVDLKAELKRRGLSTANGGMENLWRLPAEVVYQYGVDDLSLSKWLHGFALEHLTRWRTEQPYYDRCELSLALIKMVNTGLPIDTDEVRRQQSTIGTKIKELLTELQSLAAEEGFPDINVNSPKQLMAWLKIPKTDKKFLMSMIEREPHPGPRLVLEYREAKKADSTYYTPWLELVSTKNRVHPNIKLTGAATGRLSMNNPNMQNVTVRTALGRLMRECFVASPGYFFFEADYSSLEPRVGTWLSKDKDGTELFVKGLDYYKPIAARMFKHALEDVTKKIRDDSKSTALGVGYGMGGHKLAVNLRLKHDKNADGSFVYHHDHVWHMPKGGELQQVACSEVDEVYCTCEGRSYIQSYFLASPAMQPAIKGVTATALRNGYVRLPLSGRVSHVENYFNPDRKRMENTAHKKWNHVLQGTGADIMNRAIVAISKAIPEARARLLLTVHDSLLCEIPLGAGARETCDELLYLMETTTRIAPVPLVAEAKFGTTWANMTKYVR
jgi:DNA polymerase-1